MIYPDVILLKPSFSPNVLDDSLIASFCVKYVALPITAGSAFSPLTLPLEYGAIHHFQSCPPEVLIISHYSYNSYDLINSQKHILMNDSIKYPLSRIPIYISEGISHNY